MEKFRDFILGFWKCLFFSTLKIIFCSQPSWFFQYQLVRWSEGFLFRFWARGFDPIYSWRIIEEKKISRRDYVDISKMPFFLCKKITFFLIVNFSPKQPALTNDGKSEITEIDLEDIEDIRLKIFRDKYFFDTAIFKCPFFDRVLWKIFLFTLFDYLTCYISRWLNLWIYLLAIILKKYQVEDFFR